jgi:hypothetical protein
MSRNRTNEVVIEESVENNQTVETVEIKKTYDIPALFTEHKTKSNVIRFLSSEGLKTGEIAKMLQDAGVVSVNGTPIRYQHVRNVLTQPVKKTEAA